MIRPQSPFMDSFNSIQDEQVLLAYNVRTAQFVDIVDSLITSEPQDTRHLLLTGTRGSGKTYLVERVAKHVENSHLAIALMRHEQEILSIADLYLELLLQLSRILNPDDLPQQPELAATLESTYQALYQHIDDNEVEQQAHRLLSDIVTQLDKKLLLCIENLPQLLKDTDTEFSDKLHDCLSDMPNLVVLATAVTPQPRPAKAFERLLEDFRSVELPPLSDEQSTAIWTQLNNGEDLKLIRPLSILAQGTPKALTVQSLCPTADLQQYLATLVKNYGDYFELHLKSIAPKERKVYLSLVDLWQPATTKQITDRARLDMRAVSALLGRLVSKGLILEQSTGKNGKGKIYRAADPILCLYYRYHKERQFDGPLKLLLQFMTTFYSHKDWSAQRQSILKHDDDKLPIGQLLCSAIWSNEPLAGQLAQMIDLNQLNIALGNHKEAFEWLTDYIGPIDDAQLQQDNKLLLAAAKRLAKQAVLNQFPVMRCMANDFIAIAQVSLGQPMAAVTTYQSIIDEYSSQTSALVQVFVGQAQVNMGLCFEQLRQFEAASKCYSDAISKAGLIAHDLMPTVKARALYLKGMIYRTLEKPASAVNALARLTNEYGEHLNQAIQTEVAKSYLSQGLIWYELEQSSHSVKSLTKLTELKYSEVEKVQESVVKGHLILSYIAEQNQQMTQALNHLETLLEHWQDKKANFDSVRRLLAETWLQRAILLYKSGHSSEAMESLKSVFATSAQHGTPSYSALTLVTYLAADINKIPQLLELFSSNEQLEKACLPMVVALRLEMQEAVYVSDEHLMVAQDIRENIAQVRHSA